MKPRDSDMEKEAGALTGGPRMAGVRGPERSEQVIGDMWRRLASAEPPLAEAGIAPTNQTVERLVDGFVELVRFVDDFEKSRRVLLAQHARRDALLRGIWDAYLDQGDILGFVRKTLAPRGGRPVVLLKAKLGQLHKWTDAGSLACDAAIQSIASELERHLLGPAGAAADPKCTIREYIRNNGPEQFGEHMKDLLSKKFAETFGRV